MEIVSDGPTLVLSGDFDVRSTWEVRNALRERLHGHEQDVVVDLTDVLTMDARVVAGASPREPRVRPGSGRDTAENSGPGGNLSARRRVIVSNRHSSTVGATGEAHGPGGRGTAMEILTDGPILHLSGDFDVRSTWEVRNAIYDHLEGHDEDVVVDLTEVTTIDLTAL